MTVDFRSDTLSRPDLAMLDAMRNANVGDDVFGEDDTVKALEQKIAAMFGVECLEFGRQRIRFVTYLDITPEMIGYTISVLSNLDENRNET